MIYIGVVLIWAVAFRIGMLIERNRRARILNILEGL